MNRKNDRLILIDPDPDSRTILAKRLTAQGYAVEASGDPAEGASQALANPPAALIADLWMPGISGVQLCRLLCAEPATSHVPIVLRGAADDPRNRFWAERAGATAYVPSGRMGDLVRALDRSIAASPQADDFFMQLSGAVDVRDRIARHLDAALFDSAIASEVRALANAGSVERLFDLLAQFLSQVCSYRWMALATTGPDYIGLHHHPTSKTAWAEMSAALEVDAPGTALRVVDEDAQADAEGPPPMVRDVVFGNVRVARLALAPRNGSEEDTARLLDLVARELGGPVRMTALVEESQRLATIDPLTSLMNRRAFMATLQPEISRSHRYGHPLCLLLLDVDHFKLINDRRGHIMGDQVLSRLGALLRSLLRASDFAARWGGEEFVVALTSTAEESGTVAAERIRSAVEAMLVADAAGDPVSVTVSVGVTGFAPGDSLDGMLDRADRAMYLAKSGGRNRVEVADPPPPRAPAEPLGLPQIGSSEIPPPLSSVFPNGVKSVSPMA